MQIRLKLVQDEDLPFSKATDVFAYGTVWFELITHELPYKRLHPEVHIWQGAKGRLPIPEGITTSYSLGEVRVWMLLYNWKEIRLFFSDPS